MARSKYHTRSSIMMVGDCIGYAAEGNAFTRKMQYDPEAFPLTPELKKKGLTEEQWSKILEQIRSSKGLIGLGGGFSKAITQVNADYFDAIGCVAAYAEYHKGQKAIVVLTKDALASGRVTAE
jgi:type 1 glutamine amidotransferase